MLKSKSQISLLLIFILLTCLLSACAQPNRTDAVQEGDAVLKRSEGTDVVSEGGYLLSVDGFGVTEEEFLLFLRDQKAVTVNYYWTNHKLQADGGFWTTEVEGRTPLNFAKEKALDALVRAKQEFLMADEYEILDYVNYDQMMQDMEAENRDRAEKASKGEAIYGLSEYTPFTYYTYLSRNLRNELKYKLAERSNPSEEELRSAYEANKSNFWQGAVYRYSVTDTNGKTERFTQNSNELQKDDSVMDALIYTHFSQMNPGESIAGFNYYGTVATVTLDSVEDLGFSALEDVEEGLKIILAESELSRMIEDRCHTAEIAIDQVRYDALKMP